MTFISRALTVSLALFEKVLSQSVHGPHYNNPTAGPPSTYFAAAPTIPVSALQSAATQASTPAKDATYPVNSNDGAARVIIHSDWASFNEGAAFVWIADMDVDCDGLDYQCKGNPDGQPQTDFGALSAYEVPWIVIPNRFAAAYHDVIPGNNVGAVICNGRMFYGIYGDSNGDDPEVIGEASWLMARTCFPNENLNGNNGHTGVDVTYILFTSDNAVLPSSAIDKNYITNFTTLRSMGDSLMIALARNLKLKSARSPSSPSTSPGIPTSSPSGGSCSWPGHCAGALCSSDDDCAGTLVCQSEKCAHSSSSWAERAVNHAWGLVFVYLWIFRELVMIS